MRREVTDFHPGVWGRMGQAVGVWARVVRTVGLVSSPGPCPGPSPLLPAPGWLKLQTHFQGAQVCLWSAIAWPLSSCVPGRRVESVDCCRWEALRHLEGFGLLWEGPSRGPPYHPPAWSPSVTLLLAAWSSHLVPARREAGAQAAVPAAGGGRPAPQPRLIGVEVCS